MLSKKLSLSNQEQRKNSLGQSMTLLPRVRPHPSGRRVWDMEIEHEPDQSRYVLKDGDTIVGEVEYVQEGSTLSLLRAEVPVELRGQGLGVPLVRGTLEAIRNTGGLQVVPVCPYIAKFMMKNTEFQDLRA